MDECGDLTEFDASPLDLSLMNFSFKVSLYYFLCHANFYTLLYRDFTLAQNRISTQKNIGKLPSWSVRILAVKTLCLLCL